MLVRAISAVANLSDLTLYVIDVAAGNKIPRKGGPGITLGSAGDQQDRSGAIRRCRSFDNGVGRKTDAGERPFLFTNLKDGTAFPAVVEWLFAHV